MSNTVDLDAMAQLRSAKATLRKAMRHKLSLVSAKSINAQSQNVTEKLLASPEYRDAKTIGVYLSMPQGEICTREIVRDALKHNKKVFVPYTYKSASAGAGMPKALMDMVLLHSIEDYESLQPDAWGIPTPSGESVPSRRRCLGDIDETDTEAKTVETHLDMIVMPGMAFDREHRRLGHGKGFYDCFLQRYDDMTSEGVHKTRLPSLIGLGLKEQLLDQIPVDDSDRVLDELILGDGEIIRNPRASAGLYR